MRNTLASQVDRSRIASLRYLRIAKGGRPGTAPGSMSPSRHVLGMAVSSTSAATKCRLIGRGWDPVSIRSEPASTVISTGLRPGPGGRRESAYSGSGPQPEACELNTSGPAACRRRAPRA